jgi:hypothetical protein
MLVPHGDVNGDQAFRPGGLGGSVDFSAAPEELEEQKIDKKIVKSAQDDPGCKPGKQRQQTYIDDMESMDDLRIPLSLKFGGGRVFLRRSIEKFSGSARCFSLFHRHAGGNYCAARSRNQSTRLAFRWTS